MRHFIGPKGVACGVGDGDPTLEQAMTWGAVDCPACLAARPQVAVWEDASTYFEGDDRSRPMRMRLEVSGIVVAIHRPQGRSNRWLMTARVDLPVATAHPLQAMTLEAAQREALLVLEQLLRDRWQRAAALRSLIG